ncbi:MAG: hypothetical protein AAGJ82_06105 [Bacteroidota bacterium]
MTTSTLQLPLHGLRSHLLLWGYRVTYPLYAKLHWRPRPVWQVRLPDLLRLPPGSLGYRLGQFLQQNALHLMPGFENHDVFHVLLDYRTSAPAEVAMQWCLLGNGKRSLYCFLCALTGAALFPEHWVALRKAYRRGRKMRRFHHWYFEYLLRENRAEMLAFLNYKETQYVNI